MTSEATLLILEFPSPRVTPARPEVHDHLAMEATRVVVSWCLVPASRATRRSASAPSLIFIARAECQPVHFVVVRAITFC